MEEETESKNQKAFEKRVVKRSKISNCRRSCKLALKNASRILKKDVREEENQEMHWRLDPTERGCDQVLKQSRLGWPVELPQPTIIEVREWIAKTFKGRNKKSSIVTRKDAYALYEKKFKCSVENKSELGTEIKRAIQKSGITIGKTLDKKGNNAWTCMEIINQTALI